MAVVIQAGHVNIEENCDEGLRGETGAPGEREYVTQVAAEVAGALQAHGLICIVADANFNCTHDAADTTYQAVVALHCDGRTASGFAVGVGSPAQDGAATESARLRSDLRSAYAATNPGLADIDDLTDNPNVTEYYLFNVLAPATPFALIELGAIAAADGSPGPDRDYLLSHTGQVGEGVVNGVLQFLGLLPTQSTTPTEAPPLAPPPPNPPTPAIPAGTRARLQQAIAQLQDIAAELP